MRSFLDLTSYYRRFVKEFSKISAPITNLLKGKSNVIDWTPECNSSFHTLKSLLTETPILTNMNHLKRNIILCIDASDLAIGAILMHHKKIIAYESHKLNTVELNYPVYEKELLGIIYSLKVWRHYLLRVKFRIQTDHESLRYLSTQPDLSRR